MRLIFPVLALLALPAAAGEILSDNYYAMLKVDSSAPSTAFVIPFVKLEAATNMHPVSVAKAVDVRTLTVGDTLMIYNHERDNFNEYMVKRMADSNIWEVQTVNTMTRSGEIETTTCEVADLMTVKAGYGSLIMRQNTAAPVILHGQLPYSARVGVESGVNLVGSIGLDETDLNNCAIDWTKTSVSQSTRAKNEKGLWEWTYGDTIVFWTKTGVRQELYYYAGSDGKLKWGNPFNRSATAAVPTALAFWMDHYGSGFEYEMTQPGLVRVDEELDTQEEQTQQEQEQ